METPAPINDERLTPDMKRSRSGDGVQAARDELRQMQLMGMTVLVAGKCDNKNSDGSCAGHPTQEEKAA